MQGLFPGQTEQIINLYDMGRGPFDDPSLYEAGFSTSLESVAETDPRN